MMLQMLRRVDCVLAYIVGLGDTAQAEIHRVVEVGETVDSDEQSDDGTHARITFFFFKGPGPPRDLPSSPTRPFPVLPNGPPADRPDAGPPHPVARVHRQ